MSKHFLSCKVCALCFGVVAIGCGNVDATVEPVGQSAAKLIGGSRSRLALATAFGQLRSYYHGDDGNLHETFNLAGTWWDFTPLYGRWILGNPSTAFNAGNLNVFYNDRGTKTLQLLWADSHAQWTAVDTHNPMEPGDPNNVFNPPTSPFAYQEPNGTTHVFYGRDDRSLHEMWWNGAWIDWCPSVCPQIRGNPSAAFNAGYLNVFYNEFYTQTLQLLYRGPSGWQRVQTGHAMADMSSPVAFEDPSSPTRVFYAGADGFLHEMHWTGSNWDDWAMNGGRWISGNPSAAYNAGFLNVFYNDRGSQTLQLLYLYPRSGWISVDTRFPMPDGADPQAREDPVSGFVDVYYRGATGTEHVAFFNGVSWEDSDLGYRMAP
jgi:hypothetical protein